MAEELKQVVYYSNGLNLFSIVYAAIIIMKIAGIVTWSWWWITIPFWGGFALLFAFGILILIGYTILVIIFLIKKGFELFTSLQFFHK